MALTANEPGDRERRSSGLLRVPFIRRCLLGFADGRSASAFIVNINVLGAYIARDDLTPAGDGKPSAIDLPRLGEFMTCRFRVPDEPREMEIGGIVSWHNTRQQHPVHSLPPGFGLRFEALSPRDRAVIEKLVDDYVARTSRPRPAG